MFVGTAPQSFELCGTENALRIGARPYKSRTQHGPLGFSGRSKAKGAPEDPSGESIRSGSSPLQKSYDVDARLIDQPVGLSIHAEAENLAGGGFVLYKIGAIV